MNLNSRFIRISLSAVAVFLVVFIAGKLPLQWDLTETRLYTLSEASRSIAGSLQEPMTLRFYFSRKLEGLPVPFKNYATRVEDLLRQFQQASGGKIELLIVDPEPVSEAEEEAIRVGIEARRTNTGDSLFFGLQAIQAEREKVIPMFSPDRESFLEIDIAQLIYETQQVKKPVLGIVSRLELFGQKQANPMMGQMPRPSRLVTELQRTYDVREVTGDTLDEAITVLALLHPAPLSEKLAYAVDQFVLSGKPVLIAVDPSNFVERQTKRNPMMMMGGSGSESSDVNLLFNTWGITFDPAQVLGDFKLARLTGAPGSRMQFKYPYWLSVSEFDEGVSLASGLNELWLIEPGFVSLAEKSTLQLTPVIQSTDESGTRASLEFAGSGQSDWESLTRSFKADGKPRTVAAIITGTFPTAFEGGEPKKEDNSEEKPEGDKPEASASKESLKTGKGTLIVIADADFLSDPLLGEEINLGGYRLFQPYNDNLSFVVNAIDQLGGNPALLTLRGKGGVNRPFEFIDEIRVKAQKDFQAEVDGLNAKLSKVQARIDEINKQKSEEGRLMASQEATEAVRQFRKEEADLRKQIRLIEKEMSNDIEAWKARLAFFNTVPVPVAVGAAGVYFFSRRNNRRRA